MGRHFGEILLDAGLIDQDQFEGYSTRAVTVSSHLGLLLIEDGIATDREIAEALGLQSDFPLVQLSQLRIPGYVAKLISLEQAEHLAAVPVSIKQENGLDVLYVAFFDPTDVAAIEEIRKTTNKRIKPVVASLSDIRAAIRRSFTTKKPRGERKTLTEGKALVSDISSGRIPVPPPSRPVAAPPEVTAPWPDDEGMDLPEAQMDDFDAPSESQSTPAPAPKNIDIEFGDLGLDLDFGEEEVISQPPATRSDDPGDEALFDFAPEDDPATPEAQIESFEIEGNAVGGGETVLDFLSMSNSRLGTDDDAIIRRQQEAEKSRRTATVSLDDDLDFARDSVLDAPPVAAQTDDPFGDDPSPEEDMGDLDFGGSEVSTDEFIESWEDDNFDLAGTSGAHPVVSPTSSPRPPEKARAPVEPEEEFEEFDFDIPEAPEFEPGASGSFPIPPSAAATPKAAPEAPRRPSRNEDWSLDVNALFDQMSSDLDSADLAPPPEELDFETASRELDRLLAMDMDVSPEADSDPGDLAVELACLVTERPDPDPADVALMSRLIHGAPHPEDSLRLGELSRRVGGVARKLMESGLVPRTEMLNQLLENEPKA